MSRPMQTLFPQRSEKSFSDSEHPSFMKVYASLAILYTYFMARIHMSTSFGHLVVQLVCVRQVEMFMFVGYSTVYHVKPRLLVI